MACALNVDQIKDLYGVLYGEIIDRIKDKKLPKFDINQFSKELYDELMDPAAPAEEEKALLYVQAIPDIFLLVAGDAQVQDYIIENDISLNDVIKLSRQFAPEDLKAVKQAVTAKKKSNKQIKVDIIKINEAASKLVLKDPESGKSYPARAGQNKARVTSVLATTPQQAIAVNPETLTDEQRNKEDEQKAMFYTVIKNAVYLANNKSSDQQDVEYEGTPIRLKPVVASTVDKSYFTERDRSNVQRYPDGVVAFIADTDGNILFFNEDGSLGTKETGRPVYEYLRKVKLENGKLYVSNRSDYYYTVVSPEEQVEQERRNAEKNKIQFTNAYAEAKLREIRAKQNKELNQLYALREYISANKSANVLLPITGGSLGYIGNPEYKTLSETDITADEITNLYIEESGPNSGFSYFILSRQKGNIPIDAPVYLQRGDMTPELASKIAQVLTTNAKLDGEPLTPYQKETYANVFLENRISKNRIKIDVQEREGIPKLVITVYPTENDAAKDKNGTEIETAEEVEKHLMEAVLSKPKSGEVQIYPANVNYNGDYIGGKTFVDYDIQGNKIKASDVSYHDFIEPFIKIEYSSKSYSYFAGFNAYLNFAIPDEIKPADQEYQPGFLIDKDQKARSRERKTSTTTAKKTENVKKGRSSKKAYTVTLNNDLVKINVAKKRGLGEATKEASKAADGSLAFAVDFDTSAEKLVKRESKEYVGITLDSKKKAPKNLKPSEAAVNNIVSNINKFSPSKLFVSGSNIVQLMDAGYTQEEIDTYMSNILKAVVNSKDLSTPITQVITTGQTGIAEAFTKAATELGINARVIAPQGYTYIIPSKNAENGYVFENDKDGFISRFGTPEAEENIATEEEVEEEEVDAPKPKVTRKAKKQSVKVQQKKIAAAIEKTKEELKKEDQVNLLSPIDAILKASQVNLLPPSKGKEMQRSKKVGSFLDRVFTTAADKRKADEWFEKTFKGYENLLPLERITAIVNSDAYATWSRQGIVLYEGDGGTPVDLYHEAWHGFSQIFLTYDEKVGLYTHMRDNYPRWANADFEEIEEAIAEDFRSFMKFNKKFPGIIGRIFDKIAKILRKLFGKLTRRDFTRPRDIPMVREMYDNLYNGDLAKYAPNINNAMPEFTILNRAKTIQLPKKQTSNFAPWTLAETDLINESIDSVFAITFRNYAQQHKTPAAIDQILSNPTNREAMYKNALAYLDSLRISFVDQLSKVAIENAESDEPNDLLEAQLMQKVELLTKAVESFGDIEKALDGKQMTGVVAYHIKNSRFNILKQALKDLEEEDAANPMMSQSGRDQKDNIKSSKEYASAETMMLLASVSKETGKYDSNGDPIYELNSLGVPMLEDPDLLWNRLARVLEGTMDPSEMYSIMIKYQENYPEFRQLLTLLPNPVDGNMMYNTVSEFEAETKFWQDLKKPIVKFKQLTVSKTIIEKGGEDEAGFKKKEVATYESRVVRADFDIYSIINDWKSNFVTATPTTNPYVDKHGVLNTQKIIEKLSVNGTIPSRNTVEFLKALGINLDMNSIQIKTIVNDPKVPFNSMFGVNNIFAVVQLVHEGSISDDSAKRAAAEKFKRNPMEFLLNGLDKALQTKKDNNEGVRVKIRLLAELQNEYSDGYSNFSTLTPEGNKVWEHFLDSTITRVITSINRAETWQELTDPETDVNGKFKHMRWLGEQNNPHSKFSVLLNSIFYLDPTDTKNYGKKKPDVKLNLNIIGGTQLAVKDSNNKEGVSTSSSDLTTKFLQELHTMLTSGLEEFMRHASKNTAMSLTASTVDSYAGKDNPGLYIDTKLFRPSAIMTSGNMGETQGFKIIAGHIAGEFDRIRRFKANTLNKDLPASERFENWAGYNREVDEKNGKPVLAGEVFTAFDDVLTDITKEKLYKLADQMIKTGDKSSLLDYFETDDDLRTEVKKEVIAYFEKETKANLKRLKKAKYVDPVLYEKITVDDLTVDQVDEMLVKSYTYNSWIHKFETLIIAYGDLAQYNHAKEEFHKRNAGLASGGRGFRSDMRAQIFVNSKLRKYYSEKEGYTPRNYDGTFKTAILKEKILKSEYYEEYFDELVEVYKERLAKSKTEDIDATAKEMAKTALKEYARMKEADGQGYITFEAYRTFKYLEGNWTDEQEDLYRKVVNGVKLNVEDVVQYFPPYKVQYFGNIQTKGLPLTSFHKFSLAPLIPTVHTMDTNLGKLHDMMMKQQIDYVTFESGSKIGHVTSNGLGDPIYNTDNETINTNLTFTVNTIFAEYLKNQTEINREYKKKSVFSTQLRKLILEGLYEQGRIATTDEDKITEPIVRRYLDHVEEYTNLLKEELLNEIGFEFKDGEYIPVDTDSNAKLLQLIRNNLDRDDVLGDHLIDLIDINEDGTIAYDLSIHPEAAKIEKVLLSIINKRVIKQKVKGEPLVQVSGAMYEGIFDVGKYKKGTKEDIKKYAGTNFLPTYHKKIIDFDTRYENANVDDLKSFLAAKKRIQEKQSAYWTDRHKQSLRYEIQYLEDKIAGRKPKNSKIIDDTTAAMKVMVALQGDFVGLLNLEYKGKPIETIDRLNEAIKDDAWLDEGDNRKAITMVGVRIPVQGLNSMEFMEVYHFLPAEAGNIIVPPAEIVAKSGGDFDIDKMTVFMPNITGDGQYVKRAYKDTAAVKTQVEESKANGKSGNSVFKAQKAGLENELIEDIRAILELPSNYASLITPNGTFLLKDIADDLAQYVMEYNPFENRTNPQKGKNLSPTRVLESEYNLYKHESNIIGKRTLGLGAIENTFNVVFNSLGASMPAEFMHSKETDPRKAYMFLKHNILINKKGEKVISLSNRFDADNVNKIADIFSQMINGWVDVEKDAWIFFIQGNYEVAPTLLYLVKAGVPIKDAIYFVSQPLVREYVNEQRLIKSTYADPLRRKTDAPVKYSAASNVISKYFPNPKTLNKGRARYDRAVSMSKEYFKDREAQFTTEEMYQLIKDSALQPVDKKVTVLVGDPTTGYKEVETVKTEFVESKAPYSELSQLMFLHFLQIETQIQGITQLKMNSNPDTSTDSTLFEAEETLANLETLETETKLDQDLFKSMLTDSVISSFFNEKMALGISKPLFPLRYHPSVSKFLIDLSKSRVLRDQAKLTFGEKGEGAHVVAFRNDLISYIFQNALRKYKLANSYTGYEMTDSIPVSLVPQLKFGAFVKENEAGVKTLYIDKKALKKEFESKEWMLGSESDNSYQKRKLFPLNIQHFSNNAGTNFDEYIRFVAEREFLRDLYPIKDNVDPLELKITKVLFPKMDEADQRRYTYERFLAHRALENTFNPYHLFKDPNYSFANKFNEIIKKHPDMMKQFKVLQRMKVDSNDSRTMFNVYLSDKDITNAKAGVYHGDLIKLADPNVQKVSDTQENLMISDFFEKMSIVAFLQSGLSKSKYSFTNIADFDLFLSIMQQEGNKFIKLLDNPDNADIILKDFNTMFVRANKFSNRDRNRFKNYLTKLDLADFDAKTAVESDVTATAEDTKLEPLNMPGVFIFKSKKNAAHYKALIKDNPEVVFFTNEVLAKLADKTGTLSFPGETMLADMSDGMSIRIPTSYLKANDNMANFSEENYPAAIERFERRIKAAKDLLLTEDGEWTGNQLAFSDTGYGDPTKMPEKLFVYLSRRLYEEFGYLNPGSEQYKEIQDIVVYRQGISDQEIIDKFDSETKDPFKCD